MMNIANTPSNGHAIGTRLFCCGDVTHAPLSIPEIYLSANNKLYSSLITIITPHLLLIKKGLSVSSQSFKHIFTENIIPP
jgi:hypothetical protein